VVLQTAQAVQAVVEAAPADLAVSVTSRYPIMPTEWATSVPDVQVPWQAVDTESVTAADQPAYTGIFVAGPAETIAAVRMAGTSGAEQAPLMTGELLTDLPAQIELGRTVLARSGGAQMVSRTLQVLSGAGEPGVIMRGSLVRWVDPDSTWVGMTRALRIDWQFGLVRQTVACERRLSFPVGTYVPPPPPVPQPIGILYAPLTAGPNDTISPVGSAASSGSVSFGAAGATISGAGGGNITYGSAEAANSKLFAGAYPTKAIAYSVKVEATDTGVSPGATTVFYLFRGFPETYLGFGIGASNSLRVIDYRNGGAHNVNTAIPAQTFPTSAVLSIRFDANSNVAKLYVDSTLVYESQFVGSRPDAGITIQYTGGPSLRWSDLRMQELP
jgi:hypothetical protein